MESTAVFLLGGFRHHVAHAPQPGWERRRTVHLQDVRGLWTARLARRRAARAALHGRAARRRHKWPRLWICSAQGCLPRVAKERGEDALSPRQASVLLHLH